jgi:hypothetical protein
MIDIWMAMKMKMGKMGKMKRDERETRERLFVIDGADGVSESVGCSLGGTVGSSRLHVPRGR